MIKLIQDYQDKRGEIDLVKDTYEKLRKYNCLINAFDYG